MITLELERVIRRPVQAVWDFFSDFEAMPSWQPEFRELVQQTPGPVGVGTDDATTRVVDHLDAELQGLLRLFSPILRRQFAQEGSRHLDEAVRRLEAASAAPKDT